MSLDDLEERSLRQLRLKAIEGHDGDFASTVHLDVVDRDAATDYGGGVWETVMIPNRSKSQHIRQTTTNGRNCIFLVDAHTWPRLASNDTQWHSSSISSSSPLDGTRLRPRQLEELDATDSGGLVPPRAASVADKIKWVEGEPPSTTAPPQARPWHVTD